MILIIYHICITNRGSNPKKIGFLDGFGWETQNPNPNPKILKNPKSKPKKNPKIQKNPNPNPKKIQKSNFFGFKKIKIRGKRFFLHIKTCFT